MKRIIILAGIWLALTLAPSPARAEFKATFLGVSTILFQDGNDAIMIDGFFTRPSKRKLAGKLKSDDALIAAALTAVGNPKLAAVLVAHGHHDHAMDSAAVAIRSGAVIAGSSSTKNIVDGRGFQGEFITLKGGETFERGGYTITAIATPHGWPNVLPGSVSAPLPPSARAFSYRDSENFSYLIQRGAKRILVHPSASIPKGGLPADMRADVVFLGIGSLGIRFDSSIERYWTAIVKNTGARVVVPVHWDDFTAPLTVPLKRAGLPIDNVGRTLRILDTLKGNVAIRVMQPYETIDLSR